MKYKKGEIETSMLVTIILMIAAGVVLGGIVWVVVSDIDIQDVMENVCWISNGFKSSSIVFEMAMPSACDIFNVEHVDEKELASMMKKAWRMYGKGDWDFDTGGTEYLVYYFSVDHDIDFLQFIAYLQTTSDGNRVDDPSKSDYAYIEEGSEGRTICSGKQIHPGGDATERPVLKKLDEQGRTRYYYLIFYDDAEILGQGGEYGDKLVIAGKPNRKQEGVYYCYSLYDQTKLLEIGEGRRFIPIPFYGEVEL